eukprot:COSAG06_NODE_46463_length_346_cov_1.797571_1_plen_83_part_00
MALTSQSGGWWHATTGSVAADSRQRGSMAERGIADSMTARQSTTEHDRARQRGGSVAAAGMDAWQHGMVDSLHHLVALKECA